MLDKLIEENIEYKIKERKFKELKFLYEREHFEFIDCIKLDDLKKWVQDNYSVCIYEDIKETEK